MSTILISEIIDEARDFHPSFDKKRHTDKALLRQVTRAERRIVKKVVELDETALAEERTYRNLQVALIRGLDLPEHLMINEVTYSQEDITRPVALVSYTDRLTEGLRRFPAAYLLGNRLFPINRTLTGGSDTGWDDIDLIKVVLVPLPSYHRAPTETISLPDVAHEALVANLVHFMALRTPLPEANVLFAQSQQEEASLVTNLANRSQTSSWQVRVTHYP